MLKKIAPNKTEHDTIRRLAEGIRDDEGEMIQKPMNAKQISDALCIEEKGVKMFMPKKSGKAKSED